jgi:hypothetical protein
MTKTSISKLPRELRRTPVEKALEKAERVAAEVGVSLPQALALIRQFEAIKSKRKPRRSSPS